MTETERFIEYMDFKKIKQYLVVMSSNFTMTANPLCI